MMIVAHRVSLVEIGEHTIAVVTHENTFIDEEPYLFLD